MVGVGLAKGEAATNREEKTKQKQAAPERSPSDAKPTKRKRRFPYRKVPDIETEIHKREERIEELHELLASPDVLRNGDRVKEIKAEADQQQETLATLYEHWEEAVELN